MCRYDGAKILELTVNAVIELRKSQPDVPIILVDHLGYPHLDMSTSANSANSSNKANLEAYQELVKKGYLNIYHLSYDDISMPNDGTVEGIHPSDLGMRAYADAYIKMIRSVIDMPEGELVTEQAVTQQRDAYNWKARHAEILSSVKERTPKVVVLGNSIMHQWGGVESANYPCMRGADSWDKAVDGKDVINMGAGYDKVENVLWRVHHGALDGYDAERVIIAIGVNNFNAQDENNERNITEGIRTLIRAVKVRQPSAEIKICGIFPMRSNVKEIKSINKRIKRVTKEEGVTFGDPGELLLSSGSEIDPSLFQGDKLHLNADGYRRIANEFFK